MENASTTTTRKTILSIVAAGITAAAITIPAVTAGAEQAPATPVAEPLIVEAPATEPPAYSPDEQAIVDWAYGLYGDNGMDLPTVIISFHRTKDNCRGHKGLHTVDGEGTSIIEICDWSEKDSLRDAWRRKTVMHELGHAWARQNLTAEQQAEFSSSRGLEGWRPEGSEWQDRGTEHAAEIVAWGLMDTTVRVDSRIDNSSCNELAESFTELTGLEATNGLTHSCR